MRIIFEILLPFVHFLYMISMRLDYNQIYGLSQLNKALVIRLDKVPFIIVF